MTRRLILLTILGLSVAVTGCFQVDPDLATLLSAGGKLVSNTADPPIGDLTATEWRVLSEKLPELASQFSQLDLPQDKIDSAPTLNDQQASDIVAFLDNNNITGVSDLVDLVKQIDANEVDLTLPDSLRQMAESLGADFSS